MESTVFLVVLGILLAAALVIWAVLSSRKGARGERAVHGILRQSLHPSEYAILRDVTLPFEGGTTHIDHLVVSRFGIFVIQAKHLSGWIFGSGEDSHWTQSFGHFRLEFPNPLRQNQAHLRALQQLLGLRTTKFHSLVVFSGKSEFRTQMPLNVVQLDRLVPFIEVWRTPLLTAAEVDRALDLVESSRLEPAARPDLLHIESLRARHAARAAVASPDRVAPPRVSWRPLGARALAGLATLALLLGAGHVLFGGLDGLRSISGAWPTAAPDLVAEQFVPATPPQARHAAAEGDRPALRCGYSATTRRCACFDPAGEKIPLEFEQCKALADETAP